MNSLVPIFVMGFMTYGLYAIIELYVRRKERMAIIEKLSGEVNPDHLRHEISLFKKSENTSSALKIGCLLIGIGLGVFIVSIVELLIGTPQDWSSTAYQAIKTMYPAAATLFGGMGLLIAYLVERKNAKKDKK